jgi:hypothetical protein
MPREIRRSKNNFIESGISYKSNDKISRLRDNFVEYLLKEN